MTNTDLNNNQVNYISALVLSKGPEAALGALFGYSQTLLLALKDNNSLSSNEKELLFAYVSGLVAASSILSSSLSKPTEKEIENA
jgi:hypothetical protein